ncbi:FtsX-like permease family protein [Anaerosporobacter faecicola]|uniref:FtsX-like permease family protein n=1 Tax=Anaerosporobacter faecicola TaxID=2718714 RepID=UPI00143C982F|nr:FtsX-like permease family protein [Anaerosporobacter faecicola]
MIAYDTIIRNYVLVAGITISFYTFIALIIYIIASVYIDMIRHQYEYGILRAHGYSLDKLMRNTFIQYSISYIIGCFIGNAIVKEMIQNEDKSREFLPIYIGICGGVFAVTCICKIISMRQHKKYSISLMRKNKGS